MASYLPVQDLHHNEVKVRLKDDDDTFLKEEARRRDVKPFALARELLVAKLNEIRKERLKEGPVRDSGNILQFRKRAA